MTRPPSYDPGETIRVSRDSANRLRVQHGVKEIATMRKILGGGVRIEADGREWRVTQQDDGWTAAGTPSARLTSTFLGGRRLMIGDHEFAIRGKKVKGLLRFTKETSPKPWLKGEILSAPPGDDPHAIVILATAAIAFGTNLDEPPPHVHAQETKAIYGAAHGP